LAPDRISIPGVLSVIDASRITYSVCVCPLPRVDDIIDFCDAERESAYDRNTEFGKFDKALDAAALNKWTVVDMKNDWERVFAVE
jgi:hypothetical protein